MQAAAFRDAIPVVAPWRFSLAIMLRVRNAKFSGNNVCILSNPALHKIQESCFHASFFSFCPLCWPPLFPPFLGTFLPLYPPWKVLCSVEQRAQRRAWRGAVPGWTSPQSSGRKFLPENCIKKKVSLGSSLIFFPCLFCFSRKTAQKTTEKARIFLPARTLESLKRKKTLKKAGRKEFQKSKEKKISVVRPMPFSGVGGMGALRLRDPLFQILGILTPARGGRIPNTR